MSNSLEEKLVVPVAGFGIGKMKNNPEYMVCPEGHYVPYAKWNYAREFDGFKDAMTLQPTYESGLYCLGCNKPYGLSKLNEAPIKA